MCQIACLETVNNLIVNLLKKKIYILVTFAFAFYKLPMAIIVHPLTMVKSL